MALAAVLLLPAHAGAAPSFSAWAARDSSEPEAIASAAGSPNVWVGEYETYSAVAFVTPGAAPPNGLTELPSDPAFSTQGGSGFVTGVTPGPDGNGWFSQGYLDRIGKITTSGVATTFDVPTAGAHPTDMTVGGDGAIWVQEDSAQKLARIPPSITKASQITEYNAPHVTGLTSGPDGALYFSEGSLDKIARMGTNGAITNEYPLGPGMSADQLIWGPNESGERTWIWFTDPTANKLGRLDPATGASQEFTLPAGVSGLQDIAAASDGRVYATASGSDEIVRAKPMLGSIVTEAFQRSSGVAPYGITAGPDGNVWFTERFPAAGSTKPDIVRMGIVAAAASTAPATAVGNTAATLNSTVNPNGSPTHYAFVYATNPGLTGASTSPGGTLAADESSHPAGESISGLTTGVTYYYKVVADNGNGAVAGTMRSFTPGSPQPNAPHSTAPPTLSGIGRVSQTLSCTPGTWTNGPTVFSYQWNRAGVAIGGATAATYSLVDADADQRITCTVTAGNGGGAGTATSAPLTPTALSPQNVDPPQLSGVPQAGSTVSCSTGTWAHGPKNFLYSWELDGAVIAGAQGSSYAPVDSDVGHSLDCRVTAANSGGSTPATTGPEVVRGRPPANTSPPRLVGTPQVGRGFTCDPGTWSPSPTEYTYEWLRDGAVIPTDGQPNYSPIRSDIDHQIACRVTAFNGPFVPGDPVTSGAVQILPPPPSFVIAPKITGDVVVGGIVTCDPGDWIDADIGFSYQWYRGSDPIVSANADRYFVAVPDAGQPLSCLVSARGRGGSTEARSAAESVPLIVRNMRVTGIEVTQAIQQGSCTGCVGTLPSRDQGNLMAKGEAQYQGVRMAAGHWTVVRVFADYTNPGAFGGGPLQGVTAQLQIGGDATHKPVFFNPDSAPPSIPEAAPGAGPSVTIGQRDDASASFNFLIPWQETERRSLSFRATVGPINADPQQPRQCDGCNANTFDLLNVPFVRTADVPVHPYQVTINGVGTDQSETDVFGTAQTVLPVNVQIYPYGAQVPVESILNDASVTDKTSAVSAAIAKRASDDKLGNDQYPIGVFVNGTPGLGGSTMGGRLLFDSSGPPVSIVRDKSRPLDSVMHEIGHGLGLPHADTMPHPSGRPDCGGDSKNTQPPNGTQVGEAWPPDNEGLIQGVGFDRRAWDIYRTGSLPRAFSDAYPAATDHYFDFMSYCSGGDQTHHWISVRNWNRLLDFHPPAQTFNASDRRAIPTVADPVRVIATVAPGGQASIFDVAPGQTTTAPATPGSPFRLELLDAAGKALASVAPALTPIHVDGRAPGLLLEATLPLSASVASVAVSADGQTVASRHRSADPPVATLLFPRRGASVGGSGAVKVRWSASDADHDPLTSAVDYSADDGRTWQVIADGVSRTSVVVPSRFLSASRTARLRVRVSDGFDIATAISGRFKAAGAPPIVRILTGVPGGHARADALLLLQGSAFDDAQHVLRGRRLRWFAGTRPLGTGEQIAVQGLPPGATRIRLVAVDSHGRRGESSFPLRVASVRPIFLVFGGPGRVGRGAHRITLTVASTVPAVLRIAGRRSIVGRGVRTIVVAIKPGRSLLRVPYTLTAFRRVTRGVFTAPRR